MLEYTDFQTVCPDDLTAALGFQIYQDLKNETDFDLQPNFDDNLKVFYLNNNNKAYLPILHTKEVDFRILEALQEKLKNITLFLAIVDNTANILYYQINEGLCEKLPNKNLI
ncbi:uncharacterized protein LOC108090383 [Drosophila ficusphila]|uniref:uncharacterized protein LOC108090383 n=1 Tax=Drosophila ficusphila TaxID=30025 RepID=UPI0007E784C6|nr:uncharacterized protein LOC108090383 [Drosophila ficusphila]